ncbi:hypothetical protein FIBSPDRAFT_890592 [Athelia psychrophila]|uniref:Uncharacterized protein n=1 Tax=Athelia psychrophila TaxID=1759441 RepID=A0A166KU56_9AGAM|nr:hypothetical protein FIBSPDRAFT_890592 [Fibularhizoctonia sp. CBS 109695]
MLYLKGTGRDMPKSAKRAESASESDPGSRTMCQELRLRTPLAIMANVHQFSLGAISFFRSMHCALSWEAFSILVYAKLQYSIDDNLPSQIIGYPSLGGGDIPTRIHLPARILASRKNRRCVARDLCKHVPTRIRPVVNSSLEGWDVFVGCTAAIDYLLTRFLFELVDWLEKESDDFFN